ncbi:MAG TPA: hypothetical protein DEF34_08210 [Desulfotomaculum sp.]|nr:MAG: hypothetical protein VR67_05850 [Peptococcaceae bacterium BRH_c8a]KJS70479.1 MAG: hypothetical protein JL56_16725 [Desulfotomaculum sp. BICA1-6]HBX23597.1 hypothetical protein [Desulfotomaculum sp.]
MFFPFRRKKQVKEKRKIFIRQRKTPIKSDYEHATELSPSLESATPMNSLFKKIEANTGENFYTSNNEYRTTFKLEQNNEFIFGTTAGVIAATVKYGFNELMQVLNIAQYDNNATSLGVVMKGFEYTPIFLVFGFITSLIIGALHGLVIAFMYTYIFSTKYFLLKSVGIGVGIWLFNFGLMSGVFNYPEPIKNSLGDIVAMLLSLIIFAVVASYALKVMGFFKQSNS